MSKIIFGLGNPGNEFKPTRHNLGARIVANWYENTSAAVKSRVKVILPVAPMNSSGQVLLEELRWHDTKPTEILLVHDDLELPRGEIKLISGGSAKGHNGVRSIQRALRTETISRLRLGLGRPPVAVNARDFVLSRFSSAEEDTIHSMQTKANQLIDNFVG